LGAEIYYFQYEESLNRESPLYYFSCQVTSRTSVRGREGPIYCHCSEPKTYLWLHNINFDVFSFYFRHNQRFL